MTEHVRVAVIGGGIVGSSVLYALARLGWTDTLLLERRQLTSGSTWHAAGNVTFFGHYPEITRLYINSIRLYQAAEAESGRAIGFHPAGSLRLATNDAELRRYHRLEALYDDLQVPYRVVSPREINELHPLMNADNVMGAAHTPTDGHLDPSGATHALAAAARHRGAALRTHCPVMELAPAASGWRLVTPTGNVQAEHVVVATSFWAREMLQALGLNLPIFPLQHHEVITGPVAELEDVGFEVPTVRDPWVPSNTRQEGDGFLCGVYESTPQFWALDGIPDDFGEELLAPRVERLEPYLLRVMERIPAFGKAGIKSVNNGPICYTPNGCPLLGPVASQRNLWLATGFAIGIGTGGGSGEYLANWIVNGAPDEDLPVVRPSRYGNDLTRDACLAMIRQTYAHGYDLPDDQPGA